MHEDQLRYLSLLARHYPSIQAASTAIINLSAQLQLPKGTDHFLSDIHGEHESFQHVIRNGAGSTWRKIEELFADTLSKQEQRSLATLIYYPAQKSALMLQTEPCPESWCRNTLVRLIKLCRVLISKYQRSTVLRLLPAEASAIIEELLYEQENLENKSLYYQSHIETIISTGSAQQFIIILAELIQDLAIAKLHVIGDIYDRGAGAHLIVDELMQHRHVDIQWGNHDIVWMGAAAGSQVCIANVIRVCLRYANMETLENAYGINLLPLAAFALDNYKLDPGERFFPKTLAEEDFSNYELKLMAKMHKAISVIQFKLEGQLIRRRPHYQMEHRLLLDKIDYEKGTILLDGVEHPLLDTYFPTVDPKDPYALTEDETILIDKLQLFFTNSKKLQQHTRFLYSKGSIYLVHDGNLLYHACISMNEDGTFRPFIVDGQEFSGKAFLDRVDRLARQAFFSTGNDEHKQYGLDAMWYLWSGAQSPLFGKEKMTTFERYFLEDPATHLEERNPYYTFRDKEAAVNRILKEFGLSPTTGHIINGHVPVKVKKGEKPVKASGKLITIDGGFSKAYQRQTGIAGYTLISNSNGLLLAAHQPFESIQKAILEDITIDSKTEIIKSHPVRMRVKHTDDGQAIERRIAELQTLLAAYRDGFIKEHVAGAGTSPTDL
ncbi:fructose-1,6-bisphosphatase [Azotosporobacter soli]|uniref:fructose-1,6-bisphosphatase n=1 Tax=Azotosporobacter soli TaxID=3055040 RepID=UPI0031FF44EF